MLASDFDFCKCVNKRLIAMQALDASTTRICQFLGKPFSAMKCEKPNGRNLAALRVKMCVAVMYPMHVAAGKICKVNFYSMRIFKA